MTNETLQLLERRKSLRAYSPDPLSAEEKQAILRAAFRAPTAGNMMLYSIIEVEDQALKDRLAHTCDEQPFIAKAPYVLIFLADYQRWFDYYQHCEVERFCQELGQTYRTPDTGDMMLACCDALIAAQNAVVAAESLGIGSCYIGDVMENYEIHRELLNLPRYVLPIAMLCFGRPAHAASDRQIPRFAPQYIVHQNAYRRFTPAELEAMFEPERQINFASKPSPRGAKNLGQETYLRKFIADFSIEMNRSVNEMLKNWQ